MRCGGDARRLTCEGTDGDDDLTGKDRSWDTPKESPGLQSSLYMIGTRHADFIKASGHKAPRQQAGHVTAIRKDHGRLK
jgi:hypothetical protein